MSKKTKKGIAVAHTLSAVKRKPWNWGKRKPEPDDIGNLWCSCIEPKLTHNHGGRGQAQCLLCGYPWYH